ncbi:hypothetical protein, partial [Laspinema palackyanum]|uniref:hypothetical protein n=1 Tax=Laspinema palackyanum TaxID=3231601 RepID=UPI00345D0FD9|nr:hypothetical protein [Laspinema sp. D2c]
FMFDVRVTHETPQRYFTHYFSLDALVGWASPTKLRWQYIGLWWASPTKSRLRYVGLWWAMPHTHQANFSNSNLAIFRGHLASPGPALMAP